MIIDDNGVSRKVGQLREEDRVDFEELMKHPEAASEFCNDMCRRANDVLARGVVTCPLFDTLEDDDIFIRNMKIMEGILLGELREE